MFVTLGLRNAWRNRSRTALGIVSMAIAAMVFTSSTTLSQGYPAMAYFEARQLCGSDIVLLPGKTRVSQEDLAFPNIKWRFQKASLDRPHPLLGLGRDRFTYGGLEGVIPPESRVNSARMRDVAIELRSRPEVKDAHVGHAIPVIVGGSTFAFIEARNVTNDLESWRMESAVRSGRYLTVDDSNSPVAVVTEWNAAPPGTSIRLEIPRIHVGQDGIKYRDYEDSRTTMVQVVGTVGFREGGEANPVGQIYSNPSIFVTEAFFNEIANSLGYTQCDTAWGVSVTLHEISALENFVSMLQREYPDFTVVSVPKMASAYSGGTAPSGVPMDMRKVTEVLSFLTAALLSATNLSVLMLSRKREIGILRSIGATRWNIAVMVITESVWIALIGALLGNLISQPAVLLNYLTNRVGADLVMGQVWMNLRMSAGFAVASAVLFGFLPLMKALRVTPAAVLRGE
ncbi:MAG TPA: ABC transporter permease [Firmicutes bacterium]|nr:ABC transporter permease [Candidatus Fermentithermobacillaceae bacterium]